MKRSSSLLAMYSLVAVLMVGQPQQLQTVGAFCIRTFTRPSKREYVSILLGGLSDDSVTIIIPAHDALNSPSMAQTIRSRTSQNRWTKTSSGKVSAPSSTKTLDSLHRERAQTKREAKDVQENSPINHTDGMNLPYEITIAGLRAYHSVHGDLVLPRRYVVPPQTPFPIDLHGVDLSSTVYNMRWWQRNVKEKPARVAELNQLGFVWERLQPEWNLVLEALITYSSLHADLLVPNKFVVPHGTSQWPRATWGLNLGNMVYRIRARNDFIRGPKAASRRDQLDCFYKFYRALCRFALIEESGRFSRGRTKALRVASTFIVPHGDDRWPTELWSFPLGVKCNAVRQKGLYVKDKHDRQRMLEELGFRWTGNADLGWLQVVHAAAIYSRISSRKLDVPSNFIVPQPPDNIVGEEEWPWPAHLWGLPLGQRLKDVRLKGAYLHGENGRARRQQLDTLGFTWKPKRGRPKAQPA
jgi:hypothetical protein